MGCSKHQYVRSLYLIIMMLAPLSFVTPSLQSAPRSIDTGIWAQLTPPTSPSVRAQMGLVYDASREVIVATGGSTINFASLNETWEYNGTSWTKQTIAGGPGGRNRPAIAHDPMRKVTVLFGGNIGDEFFNDTWEYDGVTWTKRTTLNAPSPRNGATMTYDAQSGRMVLFGGYRYEGRYVFFDETWEYDGLQWVLRNPAVRPAPRETAAMVYDTSRGVVLLFGGGRNAGNIVFNDTWEWDGQMWTRRTLATAPPARWAHAMTHDTRRNRTILFGGLTGTTNSFNDTWEYDGTTWTQILVSPTPSSRWDHGMVYDPVRDTTVLFGGMSYQLGYLWRNDTWNYTAPQGVALRPVVVLPGFAGSYLMGRRTQGCEGVGDDPEDLWPNIDKLTFSLDDNHLRRLQFSTIDDEKGPMPLDSCDVIESRAIWEKFDFGGKTIKDFYYALLKNLRDERFSVEPCHYDWRLSIDGKRKKDLVQRLEECVQNALDRFKTNQVDIVAHSTGGLIARQYVLSTSERARKVNTIVTLGTPYLGTLKSFAMLRYGYTYINELDPILYNNRLIDIALNAPSFYHLLPSERFFEFYADYFSITPLGEQPKVYDVASMSNFLQTHYNSWLFKASKNFHDINRNKIDDWSNDGLSVRYFAFVGNNISTPRWFEEREVVVPRAGRTTRRDMITSSLGDGTVLLHSADLGGAKSPQIGSATICTFRDVEHGALTSNADVLTNLKKALRGEPVNADVCSGAQQTSATPNNDLSSSRQLTLWGRGLVHIWDEQGRHAGPHANGLIENNIPLLTYTAGEQETFVSLPPITTYTIKVTMLDDLPVEMRLRTIVAASSLNQAVTQTISFIDVPVTNGIQATMFYNPLADGSSLRLEVDSDQNGVADQVLPPSAVLDTQNSADRTAPTSAITLQGQRENDGFYTGVVNVTLQASDTGSGVYTIKYSLDNGMTLNTYSEPFAISAERVPSLRVFAIDKASNYEYPIEVRLRPYVLYLPSALQSP